MKRPSISLAMIVKNEAENLPRLFDSLRDCVDEVHVTDTGSTDGTVELAQRLGAKVHHFDWVDDFAAARNASFRPVTTDYVFWMDGDDVLENPDGFKSFRDNVMGLADYWMAAYHYSSDATGKPVCTFARERVFRTSRKFQWRYFIHEGMTPDSPYGDIKIQYTPSWAVRHMRTEADLQKDRSRNLRIFEKHKDQLDARMGYYYGKELFEVGQPIEAVIELGKALSNEKLELHDRILAMQYICYAYIQCNQFEKAIQMAHQGSMLAPHRAEFYTIIGDSYIKMGKMADAIPYYSASKGCQIQVPQGYAGAIFHHEDAYTSYPRNQLARIFTNLGDLAKGEAEATESVERFKSAEGAELLKAIQNLKANTQDYSKAEACDDIVISCPPVSAYEFDPDIAKEKAMGGSETALIEMANWLSVESGRPVRVFNMRKTEKIFDGVVYSPAEQLPAYMAKFKPWIHIAWRHNYKLTDAPTFLWCHDLTTPGGENHQNYDRVLALTPFHKRYLMAMQGIPEEKIHVTRNGIRPERFAEKIASTDKDPWKFVFSSSPDRGLDRAMRVLDRVREEFPEIKLHVFYGIEHLDKYGLSSLRERLKSMMDERKDWVVYHGATQQDALIEHFKSAAYVVQPSDWIETSCISAMEFLCSGVYPIFRKVGGVADTLAKAEAEGMATLVDSDCISELDYQKYIDATLEAVREERYKRVHVDPEAISWQNVAKSWLEELPELVGAEKA